MGRAPCCSNFDPTPVVGRSPFLLAQAKALLSDLGHRDVKYVESNIEALPFPDNSFDIVSNVYTFHEMPPDARRKATAEFARVLKPGGLLVFVDSAQEGECDEAALRGFPEFFLEPYHPSYTREDLTAMFGAEGLEVDPAQGSVAWVTKVVVARKSMPAAPEEEDVEEVETLDAQLLDQTTEQV